jgi:hypothetical protein
MGLDRMVQVFQPVRRGLKPAAAKNPANFVEAKLAIAFLAASRLCCNSPGNHWKN